MGSEMDQQELRRIFLPYCVQKLEDGRYIILNRKYKPLGISDSAWVVYEEHPSAVTIKGLTAAKAKKISHKASDDRDTIHLYGDGCIPTQEKAHWVAYSERLRLLAELTAE